MGDNKKDKINQAIDQLHEALSQMELERVAVIVGWDESAGYNICKSKKTHDSELALVTLCCQKGLESNINLIED